MSYRCHIWRLGPEGETELPLCVVEHKTLKAARKCRFLQKGKEACHRWEIRGGAFVIEKGEGARGWLEHGSVEGGISWAYSQDYVNRTERLTVAVDDQPFFDKTRPLDSEDTPEFNADFARGMAHMLCSIGKYPKSAAGWLSSIRDNFRARKERRKLPENVVRGPWKPLVTKEKL